MNTVQTIGRIGGLTQEEFDLVVDCSRIIGLEYEPVTTINGEVTVRLGQEEMLIAERCDLDIAYAAADYLTADELNLLRSLIERSKTLIPKYDLEDLVFALHDEYETAFDLAFQKKGRDRWNLASDLFTKVGIIYAVRTRLGDIERAREEDSSDQLAGLAAGF